MSFSYLLDALIVYELIRVLQTKDYSNFEAVSYTVSITLDTAYFSDVFNYLELFVHASNFSMK